MLMTVNGGTYKLLDGSTTSQNFYGYSAGEGLTYLLLDFTTGDTVTLKVKARVKGSQQNCGVTATTYTAFLALVNRTTPANIAGGTGATATGLYEVDVSGCEFDIEFVNSAGANGSTLRASIYTVRG